MPRYRTKQQLSKENNARERGRAHAAKGGKLMMHYVYSWHV